jgi:hypothetical protein
MYEERYFVRPNSFCSVPLDLLLGESAGIIVIQIWWTNEEFSPVDIIPPCFFMLTYHLGYEQ